MADEVMSKTQARAWIKRCREALRDAEQALREGNGEDLDEALSDALGSVSEVYDAAYCKTVKGVSW